MKLTSRLTLVFAAIALCSASPSALAEVVCYEYLTIGGSGASAGVHVLTDYVPKSNTVVRARYASSSAASSSNNQFLFCSRLNSGADTANLHFSFAPNVSGKFRFDYYGAQNGASATFTANRDYVLEVRDGKAYVTDTAKSSVVELGSGLQPFVPQYKMALFQSYSYSGGEYGSWGNAFHGKFYFLKIFDIEDGEEVLKHYFVPCLDDGVAKLCDLVDSNATYALTVTGTGTAEVGGVTTTPTGDSYVVTESGTITLETPSAYSQLVNIATECIFDQTGDSASAENAHAFSGFASYEGAGTFFRGGWWDFGAAGVAGDFRGAADGMSYTEFSDGAVVTNVGNVYVAGARGANNQISLTGASSLFANYLCLGSSSGDLQKSKVVVSEGSTLNVSGALSMSEGTAWRNGKRFTGNELLVSGEGSRLVVGGETSLGRNLGSNSAGAIGGNTFKVENGASAELKALVVSAQTYHGERNHVVFGKDAHVTMSSFSFGGGGGGSVGLEYCAGSNLLEIVDGAVVTNTGALTFGADQVSEIGNRIIVSNATFHTDIYVANNVRYLIRGQQNELVLSGGDAVLAFKNGIGSYFLGKGSSFVVENGATYSLTCASYSYTLECVNETMSFRSGATVTRSGNFATGNTYDSAGTSNRLEVVDDASFSVSGNLVIVGKHSALVVDDGSLSVGNAMRVGSNAKTGSEYREFSNSTFRVSGSHPSVRVNWNFSLNADAKLVFVLPAGGYDDGVATDENPILRCGTTSGEQELTVGAGNDMPLVFENVEEFYESHEKRRNYVLIKSNHLESLTDERLSRATAGFPAGMTLENTKKKLILHVRPQRGMNLIFR